MCVSVCGSCVCEPLKKLFLANCEKTTITRNTPITTSIQLCPKPKDVIYQYMAITKNTSIAKKKYLFSWQIRVSIHHRYEKIRYFLGNIHCLRGKIRYLSRIIRYLREEIRSLSGLIRQDSLPQRQKFLTLVERFVTSKERIVTS